MTDLQLGLALIGVLAVAGVFGYNRLQEHRARRRAEQAFGDPGREDVLLEEPGGRREPVLPPSEPAVAAPRPGMAGTPAPVDVQPEPRADYIIELSLPAPMPAGTILEHWSGIERRFGRRALLSATTGREWRSLRAGDPGSCTALRAALQLVSRAGVTGDAELIEFRSEVETLAARAEASVSAPEMREALAIARELDRVCAEADIQVALHVVGIAADEDALAAGEGLSFAVAPRQDGVTFTLDVPRAPDIAKSYEAMARAAVALAGSRGGRVVDDQGRLLDERALASIGAQLEPVRQLLAGQGIEPGSPLALRLFS